MKYGPFVRNLGMVAVLLAVGLAPARGFAQDAAATPSFVRDGNLDLDAAVAYFEDLYRSTSSVADMELLVVTPRLERTLRMKCWTKGADKALVVITEPVKEAGTATLKVDNNLWNYLPRIRRTMRIPPSMMLSPWMGSDFTNDDLVRESSFKKDYTYVLRGKSDDPPGWLVDFTAKPEVVGLWNRFELVVDADGHIPLVARYFDRKDRLARVITWDQVQELGGRRLPARMVLVPQDKEGQRTEMIYHAIQFNIDVPDDTFSLSRLESEGK